jgi:signal transduction histidine kinase
VPRNALHQAVQMSCGADDITGAAMYRFLRNNRDELIARCKDAVSQRPKRVATEEQLRNGIPLFLEQLTRTLQAEEEGTPGESERISGPAGGDIATMSEMGVSATAHGRQLLELGYTVDQVVHDYGDLCQAITTLAVERDAPFSIDEFRTLNRCLDNAIADAVTEFSAQRDVARARRQSAEVNERVGFMVHELRNHLQTATLALRALESGTLPVSGATGNVLKRSLGSMGVLLVESVASVRRGAVESTPTEVFPLAALIADAENAAGLDANARGCRLVVQPVDPALTVRGRREPLLAALVNLLTNGFKFTKPHTEVTLAAHAAGSGSVAIEVADHCGGLPPGAVEHMFKPFSQANADRSGLGLGLVIARRSVEEEGGVLTVRDIPGTGCVFTITLPAASRRSTDAPVTA